ncbi:MAG: hypothetical protein HYY93_05905 [Planctomycetes bacterium]|nr:hypothetical protein [Planctomycetota bacterium]
MAAVPEARLGAAREILTLAERTAQITRLSHLLPPDPRRARSTDSPCAPAPETQQQLNELNETRERALSALLGRTWTREEQMCVLQHEESWARSADEIDRQRNHFIKGMRQKHGPDSRTYSTDTAAEFDRGVAAFSQKKSALLEETALALCAALGKVRQDI